MLKVRNVVRPSVLTGNDLNYWALRLNREEGEVPSNTLALDESVSFDLISIQWGGQLLGTSGQPASGSEAFRYHANAAQRPLRSGTDQRKSGALGSGPVHVEARRHFIGCGVQAPTSRRSSTPCSVENRNDSPSREGPVKDTKRTAARGYATQADLLKCSAPRLRSSA